MPVRLRRLVAAGVSLFVIASLFPAVSAIGAEPPRISHPWIDAAPDPSALQDTLAVQRHKIPSEFKERLRWLMADGTLRVMVALAERNAAIESFVEDNTVSLQWYGDDPRFIGRVTQAQLLKLLEADVVTFVDPDYPITNFMASSTLDVHARSTGEDATAVWWFDPTAGPMGALKSNVPGLGADRVTGKDVTVAITDSGIDRTNRDFGGWDCEAGPYQPCDSRIVRAVSTEHMVDPGIDPGDSLPTTEAASGHGTHVAGTVAGNAYYQRDPGGQPDASDATTYGGDGYNFGIAPQANLISTKNGDRSRPRCRVLDFSGNSTTLPNTASVFRAIAGVASEDARSTVPPPRGSFTKTFTRLVSSSCSQQVTTVETRVVAGSPATRKVPTCSALRTMTIRTID